MARGQRCGQRDGSEAGNGAGSAAGSDAGSDASSGASGGASSAAGSERRAQGVCGSDSEAGTGAIGECGARGRENLWGGRDPSDPI